MEERKQNIGQILVSTRVSLYEPPALVARRSDPGGLQPPPGAVLGRLQCPRGGPHSGCAAVRAWRSSSWRRGLPALWRRRASGGRRWTGYAARGARVLILSDLGCLDGVVERAAWQNLGRPPGGHRARAGGLPALSRRWWDATVLRWYSPVVWDRTERLPQRRGWRPMLPQARPSQVRSKEARTERLLALLRFGRSSGAGTAAGSAPLAPVWLMCAARRRPGFIRRCRRASRPSPTPAPRSWKAARSRADRVVPRPPLWRGALRGCPPARLVRNLLLARDQP
jgi:hypothetical protein